MSNCIEERIIDRIYIEGDKRGIESFYVPGIEKLESKPGYFYLCVTRIYTHSELEKFLTNSKVVGDDIEKKFGKKLAELYYNTLNRVLIIANRYLIYIRDLDQMYMPSSFTADNLKLYDQAAAELTLQLLIHGTYNLPRVNLDVEGIEYPEVDPEECKSDIEPPYFVIPVFSNKGIVPVIENQDLVFSFRIVSLNTLQEIKNRINLEGNSSITRQQNEAMLERNIHISREAGYILDNLNHVKLPEQLMKVGMDWAHLVGIDLSGLKD